MLVPGYRTTWHHIPDDPSSNIHHIQNCKPHTDVMLHISWPATLLITQGRPWPVDSLVIVKEGKIWSEQIWHIWGNKHLCICQWWVHHNMGYLLLSDTPAHLWVLKIFRHANCFLHNRHRNFFSPVWITLCSLRPSLRANRLPHSSQGYGRTPLCIILWLASFRFVLNALLHTSHVYVFWSLWFSWWFIRLGNSVYPCPHISHTNGFSVLCTDLWFLM